MGCPNLEREAKRERGREGVMDKGGIVTIFLNQQQLELVERLIHLEHLGDTPADVLRQVLHLYASTHTEVAAGALENNEDGGR